MSEKQAPNSQAPSASPLVELEVKLTFQQQTIDELHSVVLQQRNELDRLKREIKDLYNMIRKVVEQSTGDDLPFERPPHY